jgi:hypothetical protein
MGRVCSTGIYIYMRGGIQGGEHWRVTGGKCCHYAGQQAAAATTFALLASLAEAAEDDEERKIKQGVCFLFDTVGRGSPSTVAPENAGGFATFVKKWKAVPQ